MGVGWGGNLVSRALPSVGGGAGGEEAPPPSEGRALETRFRLGKEGEGYDHQEPGSH